MLKGAVLHLPGGRGAAASGNGVKSVTEAAAVAARVVEGARWLANGGGMTITYASVFAQFGGDTTTPGRAISRAHLLGKKTWRPRRRPPPPSSLPPTLLSQQQLLLLPPSPYRILQSLPTRKDEPVDEEEEQVSTPNVFAMPELPTTPDKMGSTTLPQPAITDVATAAMITTTTTTTTSAAATTSTTVSTGSTASHRRNGSKRNATGNAAAAADRSPSSSSHSDELSQWCVSDRGRTSVRLQQQHRGADMPKDRQHQQLLRDAGGHLLQVPVPQTPPEDPVIWRSEITEYINPWARGRWVIRAPSQLSPTPPHHVEPSQPSSLPQQRRQHRRARRLTRNYHLPHLQNHNRHQGDPLELRSRKRALWLRVARAVGSGSLLPGCTARLQEGVGRCSICRALACACDAATAVHVYCDTRDALVVRALLRVHAGIEAICPYVVGAHGPVFAA